MDILFKTVHGSRLYGLHHANSDYDYYTVVSKVKTKKARYAKQTIIGDQDMLVIDFGTWLYQCSIGVPQALEAMFSEVAEIDRLESFRSNFYVGTTAWDRYLRTIKSFAFSEVDEYKRKRHALRLALNMNELRGRGRFNPELSSTQINVISKVAEHDAQTVYDAALALAWSGW